MEKEFIPYEQALDLKELGFDEPCLAYYQKSTVIGNDTILPIQIMDKVSNFNDDVYSKLGVPFCSAPLYQQAFRWFREKYQLHSTITSISQESWQWHIQKPGQQLGELYDEDFYTYGEAELACLTKLIEIIKK